MERNRDADLLKIQLLSDENQTYFSHLASITVACFIGIAVLLTTAQLERYLGDGFLIYSGLIIIDLIVFGIILPIVTLGIREKQRKKICCLLTLVEKGERLPSLNELKEKNVLLLKLEELEKRVRKLEESKT